MLSKKIVKTSEDIDFFSGKITNAVKARSYHEIDSIMRDIFLAEEKLKILSILADRLASGVFEAFLLCGLSYLNTLHIDQYK